MIELRRRLSSERLDQPVKQSNCVTSHTCSRKASPSQTCVVSTLSQGHRSLLSSHGDVHLSVVLLPGNLFNQADYSDIELIVDLEHFYAHRIILAARSEYFRALLYGGLRESQHDNHTIEIKECKSAAFKILLLYIYTGRISLIKEKVGHLFGRRNNGHCSVPFVSGGYSLGSVGSRASVLFPVVGKQPVDLSEIDPVAEECLHDLRHGLPLQSQPSEAALSSIHRRPRERDHQHQRISHAVARKFISMRFVPSPQQFLSKPGPIMQ